MWLAGPPPFIAIATAIRGTLSGADIRVAQARRLRFSRIAVRRR